MRRAIELAAGGFPAPNPHVGCVIVRDEQIVGEGYHDHAGGPHAEAAALLQAGESARGAAAYVTLEPCNHHGRTPPCSRALIAAGVAKVFVAVSDPNPRAAGGVARLREAGIEVEVGLLRAEAEAVNRVFLDRHRLGRPVVAVKAAITADGYMARLDGTSKWITGDQARAAGRLLRARMGSVLVGRVTAELDDPELTVRDPRVVNQPLRVVLDPERRLRSDLKLFSDGLAPTLRLEGHRHPAEILERLAEAGQIGVLVEGGPTTIQAFFEARLVDELHLFTAPHRFGEGRRFEVPSHARLELIEGRPYGDDRYQRYDVSFL